MTKIDAESVVIWREIVQLMKELRQCLDQPSPKDQKHYIVKSGEHKAFSLLMAQIDEQLGKLP